MRSPSGVLHQCPSPRFRAESGLVYRGGKSIEKVPVRFEVDLPRREAGRRPPLTQPDILRTRW